MPTADPPAPDLCANCRNINFDAVLGTSLWGAMDRWDKTCPLCRFFRDMAGLETSSAFLKRLFPHRISAGDGSRESAFLQVRPDGWEDGALPVVTYVADGDDLDGFDSGWLVRGAEEHGEACDRRSEQVAGLMVIDCVGRSVVRLPETAEYATLSYVWGKAKPTAERDEMDMNPRTGLPARLRAVVSDAIKVALSSGLAYLWVDRYCIPQSEHEAAEKQRQIQLEITKST
ncbi:hypothetical protein B0T24DRAFT_717900 [Lasiosphaeria ovina]|uniref:Heterokaryon incompatibility domain-containing protein n=1 Tax=Lasiosphaeria ovina TaxID=92902 RepID=A0AAE0TUP4_9PEZI|nr:hypothetical protein B0T24DRAFT_717900 [Lasiosphaeria ovina]